MVEIKTINIPPLIKDYKFFCLNSRKFLKKVCDTGAYCHIFPQSKKIWKNVYIITVTNGLRRTVTSYLGIKLHITCYFYFSNKTGTNVYRVTVLNIEITILCPPLLLKQKFGKIS
jgi:hypothetical protein